MGSGWRDDVQAEASSCAVRRLQTALLARTIKRLVFLKLSSEIGLRLVARQKLLVRWFAPHNQLLMPRLLRFQQRNISGLLKGWLASQSQLLFQQSNISGLLKSWLAPQNQLLKHRSFSQLLKQHTASQTIFMLVKRTRGTTFGEAKRGCRVELPALHGQRAHRHNMHTDIDIDRGKM